VVVVALVPSLWLVGVVIVFLHARPGRPAP